jgi:hypothetical protein
MTATDQQVPHLLYTQRRTAFPSETSALKLCIVTSKRLRREQLEDFKTSRVSTYTLGLSSVTVHEIRLPPLN